MLQLSSVLRPCDEPADVRAPARRRALAAVDTPVSLPAPPAAARPRLLLVESDPAMRAMLIDALAERYHIETAPDAATAWEAAQSQRPDLIIIGLYIHGQDSLSLIQCVRASTRLALLPVVMLTSSADRALMLKCLAAGASNFLLKPFTMEELLACVRLELELHGPLVRSGS